MQKYEYIEIEVLYLNTGVQAKGWRFDKDGKHTSIPIDKYGQAFAQLGLDGWELVAGGSHAFFGKDSGAVSYFFKRPIDY